MRRRSMLAAGTFTVLGFLASCRSDSGAGSSATIIEEGAARVASLLEKRQFQDAHDVLLVMMRVGPEHPQVFDSTLSFIRKAREAGEDDTLDYAEDAYARAMALLPYQPLDRLSDARKQIMNLEEGVSEIPGAGTSSVAGTSGDSLQRSRQLLQLAQRGDLPVSARVDLCARLRSELSDVVLLTANTEEPLSPDWVDRWKVLTEKADVAEREVLEAAYRESQPSSLAWVQETTALLREDSQPHVADDALNPLIAEGQRLLREIAPYSEAKVEQAVHDLGEFETHLESLRRHREWEYNRYALKVVGAVEDSDDNPYQRLERLAAIDEQRLYPYVLRRWQENWKKNFEELPEDGKAAALKMLITKQVTQ